MGRSTREFWTEPVAEIIEQVLLKGDAAVLELTERFDHAQLGPDQLRVDPNELEASIGVLEPDVLGGLRTAVANVKAVAKAQVRDEPVTVSLAEGHTVEIVEHPVDRAAVYVPGGRAPYPSTVVMGAVTARAAGVREIAVCAPPGPGGRAHPVILAACVLCEVTEVYRMGGAQAIAALAFGTESVKAVDVIVGPGNPFVQEAKRQLVGQVGIDGIAGPSELVVIAAGAGADPELIALDLMAQAEHGEDSTVWCLSPDAKLLDAVAETVERLLPGRSSVANAELQADRRGGRGRSAQPGGADRSRAPPAHGRGGRGARRPRSKRRLPVRGRAALPRPSATTSPARTTCCPPVAPLASSRLSHPRPSGGAWPAYPCRPRRRIASRPPAPLLRVPRAFLCTPNPWSAAREPHLADTPHDG